MEQFDKNKAREVRIKLISDEIINNGKKFEDFCDNCDDIERDEVLRNVNAKRLTEHNMWMLQQSNRKRCDFLASCEGNDYYQL